MIFLRLHKILNMFRNMTRTKYFAVDEWYTQSFDRIIIKKTFDPIFLGAYYNT